MKAEPFDTPEATDFWRPKDHLDRVHVLYCEGQTRNLETQFGQATASMVRWVLVWGEKFDDGPQHRFDDELVLQRYLAAQCRVEGLRFGRLVKPDQRYEFVGFVPHAAEKIGAWVAEHVDESGDCRWGEKWAGKPEEAPF